jgi:uncharacterized protein (TIGR03437 family)
MRKFMSTLLKLSIAVALALLPAPLGRTQQLGNDPTLSGANTRVATNIPGLQFTVDGQNFNGPIATFWPVGTKHTLLVTPVQGLQAGTRYTFVKWSITGGPDLPPVNPLIVTADANYSQYTALFQIEYALSFRFNPCPDPNSCNKPGRVYVSSGTVVESDTDIYFAGGSGVVLTAFPNPGYVFAGWNTGINQKVVGFVNTVALNAPVIVTPVFQVVRLLNLDTVPSGLVLLADRQMVSSPAVMEWGWNSTHTVGVISPTTDLQGKKWVFSKWSDNGAATHAYKVPGTIGQDSLTAIFIPGAEVTVATQPQGLKLKIDGNAGYPSYNFVWGVGETHRIEAPAQQTDDKGRTWQFAGWSNDGPAAQDITVPAGADTTGVRVVATYNAVGHLTINSIMQSLSVKVDGQDCVIPCDLLRPVGTKLHVSAPASISVASNARADFNGWPGTGSFAPDWTVTLGADPIVTSIDYRTMNKLSAAADPPEGATWQVTPASPDGFYDARTIVNVSVSAKAGYRFRGWSGDLAGTAPAGAVPMTTPRLVRAMLDRIPFIPPAGSISNGAGARPQEGVAPGSVVSLFGASLTTDTTIGPGSPLAQTLSGVTIHLGDRLLPLFFVSPQQINFALPSDIPEGEQYITVSMQRQPDARTVFNVLRNAPGLFQQAVDDQSYAVALHQDGSPVTTDSPARRGELLTVYGTGFGPTDRQRLDGFALPANPTYHLTDGATVLVGDASIDAESGFAVPGRVSVDAVQFRLNDTVPSGNASFHVRINGQESNTVLLPVE